MSVVNNRFYGTTALTKTGSTGNYNYGNGFHGATTLTQSSSTAGLYWSNSGRDTSFAALTLVCSGSQPHTIANAYDFIVMGDLTVNRTSSGALTLAASNLIGKTRFEGGANQTFTSTGSAAALCYKAVVNKSAGTLSLASDLEVNNDMTLTASIVKTTGSAVLKLRDNATATGASDASHVEGRVLKVGNDAFTFPVGRNGAYRPIAISAPSSTTAEFRGEYLNLDPSRTMPTGSKDGTLGGVSTNEYWLLDRLVTSNTVNVTLKWAAMSCAVDTLAKVRVAAWDGSTWKDKGNGGTTGTTTSGTVMTSGASSIYGAFTLASTTALTCVPCRADAGGDRTTWPNIQVQIGGTSLSGMTFAWSPATDLNDSEVANPEASSSVSRTYIVTTTNTNGCSATDSMTVEVIPRPEMPPCLHGNH